MAGELCPADALLPSLPLALLCAQSEHPLSLLELHANIAQTRPDAARKVMVTLSAAQPSAEAGSAPARSAAEIVSGFFTERAVALGVYTEEGYDLTAEYDILYCADARTHAELEDYRAVLARALRMVGCEAEALVDGALAAVALHSEAAATVCLAALLGAFPALQLPLAALTTQVFPTRLYTSSADAGQGAQLWVRVCVGFAPKRIDTASASLAQLNQLYLVSSARLALDPHADPLLAAPPVRAVVGLVWSEGSVDGDEDVQLSVPEAVASTPLPAPAPASDSSASSELFYWGAGEEDSPSLDLSALPLPPLLRLQRVRQIACAASHCLVLSWQGAVFAYGDNPEGALGTGDTRPRPLLALVDLGEARLVKVSAGACPIGSHSLALDDQGRVFSWGMAFASGTGATKPLLQPRLVDTFLTEGNAEAPFASVPATDISAGGGFSLVLMRGGQVASFGLWARGRLGLGAVPLVNAGGRGRGKTRQARYQLTPRYVRGLSGVTGVACGAAHSLCVDGEGRVFAFGANAHGQLGTGCAVSGFLCDSYTPCQLTLPSVTRIACGAHHSLAVTSAGEVWSWGARGSSALGRHVTQPRGEWEHMLARSLESGQSRMMVPHELLAWVHSWARPANVRATAGLTVAQLSAGERHSALVTEDGRLYLCGAYPVVPPFFAEAFSLPSEEARTEGCTVVTPRTPSSMWLDRLSSRRTLLFASAGLRCVVLQGEELVSRDLGDALFQRSVLGADEEAVDSARVQSDGGALERRGAADCIVVTSGRALPAHQALLSRRSTVIRDLILAENPGEGASTPSQLLIPELRQDTARALLLFLYTDQLASGASEDLSLAFALLAAAKQMRLPRLLVLADNLIKTQTIVDGMSVGRESEDDGLEFEAPPSTLAKDLGSLVGDPSFADVRVLAEGRAVYAHRFVLQNRCHYFRVMFRSGMAESVEVDGLISVVVPGTLSAYNTHSCV